MWIFAPVWDVERRPWHYWNWQATADEEGLALASLSWWLKLCQSSYEKKNFLYFYISWIDIFGLIAKRETVIEVGPFFLMLGRKLLQQLGKLGYVRRFPSTMITEEVASMQSKNEMYWMKKGSWWPWSWSKPFNFLIYPFDGICVTAWLIFDTELWLLAEKRLFVACAETAPNSNATCIMYGSQWRNLLLFLSLFDDLEWVVGWKVWNVVAPLEVDT